MAVRSKNRLPAAPSGSKKELIERKALTFFSEKGYDATSMREIAEAAGVTKPVIYYYFKNKEQLCHHLISSGLEEFRQSIQSVCSQPSDDVLEQVVQMVQVHFDFCKTHLEFMRFIYAINFGPDRKKITYNFYDYSMSIFDMQVSLMRRMSQARLLKNGKEEAAVYYLRGIISTFAMMYLDGRHPLNSNLAKNIVVDLVGGLGASGSRIR